MISETMFYSNTSLYVGDLDPYVTEKNLFDKFSECGTVGLVKICRDKITRQSLGYAYVNFQQPAEAERALDTLNFELLSNKPMRIMWSQRDPALRKSGVGNVFIKNLDKSIDHKAFYDTFSEFGNIISCKIMLDENGKSKGYGFVHYETEKSAELAIEGANGKLIMGKKVYVGKFLSKFTRSTDSNVHNKPFKNVFVKNFAEKLDDQGLFNLFSKFGEITSAKVMLDENEKSKGFGFVNFVQFESAIKAVQEMNNYVLEDKTLVVTRFEKKSARLNHLKKEFEEKKKESFRQDLNLYVKNLDEKIDSIRLEKEFEKFGTILSAKVMLDENNNSKGFGFVSFSKQEGAQKALAEMNGRILSTKPLFICIAQRKEDRKRTLANKFKETFQFNSIPLLPNQYYKHQNVTVPRWQNKQTNLISVQQQYYPETNQFRNQPMPIPMQQPIKNEQDEFITYLSSVKPFMQKQVIGERLYVACLNMGHDINAGKIVGMLLDGMDISELSDLLYNEQLLMSKINEAEIVLKIHNERLMHIVQNQNSVQFI